MGRAPRYKLKIRPGVELGEFMQVGTERMRVETMQKILRESPALARKIQDAMNKAEEQKEKWLRSRKEYANG
jgi:hypothetical protein